MKIVDIIQLYEFFGSLGWLGFIAVLMVGVVVLYFSFIFMQKEMKTTDKHKQIIAVIAISVFAFSMILLKVHSNHRTKFYADANLIKSQMIANDWYICGLGEISNSIYNMYNEEISEKRVLKVVKNFPEEFIVVKLTNENDPLGLKLLQDRDYMVSFAKSKVYEYMKYNNDTIMSYSEIKNIDKRFDFKLIDMMVAEYDTLFSAININSDVYAVKANL